MRDNEKKVAFDIGNVICHVDINKFCNYLVQEKIFNNFDSSIEFLSGIQHPQDLGLYDIKRGFRRFNPNLSNDVLQKINEAWLDTVVPSVPMLSLIEQLLSDGYKVALLSNIGVDHASLVRKQCDIFSSCIQHFSCEVGARKPTKLFYQSFAIEYGWENTVKFFDDRQDNVISCKGYFKGIRFDLDDYSNDEEASNHMRDIINNVNMDSLKI